MQEILTQRFKFARITPYRDYSKLEEKRDKQRQINDDLDLLDETSFPNELEKYMLDYGENTTKVKKITKKGKVTTLPQNRGKVKKFFFSSDDDVQEKFVVNYFTEGKRPYNSFETSKDYQIKRHFGRAFSSIECYLIERKIKIENNKLTVRLYVQTKTRGFNCIYFKKHRFIHSITFDLINGNFTTVKSSKNGKNTSTNIRKNSFSELQNILKGNGLLQINDYLYQKNTKLYDEFVDAFDNEIFIKKLRENLDVEYDSIKNETLHKVIFDDYMKYFIKLKKIKVPNGDYRFWLTNFYPTEKYLKKNDRKLIASILDMLDFKSKITIKILHQYPNIDLCSLKWICEIFGNDYQKYISNISKRIYEDANKSSKVEDINKFTIKNRINRPNYLTYLLNDGDKENLIKIINSKKFSNSDIFSPRFITLIDDHFLMIEKLRNYIPELSLKAKTYDDFHKEHRELSKMISSIKKGWVTEYKFTDKLINEIEKPIEIKHNLGTDDNPIWSGEIENKNYLYPFILKREEDYDEEGNFMHHCVASYSNKEKSIIISIRNEGGDDRVTCEYDIQTGKCIQERHFCNAVPPKHFEYALKIMKEMVKRHSNYGTLNWIEKNRVPVKVNGVQIVVEDRQPQRLIDLF